MVIASLIFGINPLEMLGVMGGERARSRSRARAVGAAGLRTAAGAAPAPRRQPTPDERSEFSGPVLGDTEDVWTPMFAALGTRYTPPTLVLFSGAHALGLRLAPAPRVGPFYCPGDRKLYLDTAFFDELRSRFGAPGDFAQAYVIAHEVGHHVQNLLGTMQQFDAQSQRLDEREPQRAVGAPRAAGRLLRRRLGVLRANKRNLLEPGDLEEGMRAAAGRRRRHDHEADAGHGRARRRSRTAPRSSARAGSRRGYDVGRPAQLRHLRRVLTRALAPRVPAASGAPVDAGRLGRRGAGAMPRRRAARARLHECPIAARAPGRGQSLTCRNLEDNEAERRERHENDRDSGGWCMSWQLGLAGCAPAPLTTADVDGSVVCNADYMDQVERAARTRWRELHWVNCPQVTTASRHS